MDISGPKTVAVLAVLTLALAAAPRPRAQGTRADYERAANLRAQADGKLRKGWIEAQWLADGKRFWYKNDLAEGGSEFVFVDAEAGRRQVAFDPASTMQVVNALIKADKDFDLVIVPGARHGVGEIPYLRRRRQDFFVRHLLGLEPRRE